MPRPPQCRENVQAKDLVGYVVADVLKLNGNSEPVKAKVKTLLKTWISSGALVVVKATDRKGNVRPVVVVGQWAG